MKKPKRGLIVLYFSDYVCFNNIEVQKSYNGTREEKYKQTDGVIKSIAKQVHGAKLNSRRAIIQVIKKKEISAQVHKSSIKVFLRKQCKISKTFISYYFLDCVIRRWTKWERLNFIYELICSITNVYAYPVIYLVFSQLSQSIGRWGTTEKNTDRTDECYKAALSVMTSNGARQSETTGKTDLETEEQNYYEKNNQDTQRMDRERTSTVIHTAGKPPRQQKMLKVSQGTRGDQEDQHKVMNQFINYNEHE